MIDEKLLQQLTEIANQKNTDVNTLINSVLQKYIQTARFDLPVTPEELKQKKELQHKKNVLHQKIIQYLDAHNVLHNKRNYTYVYTLACEEGKYYVGYTTCMFRRMSSHMGYTSSGAAWTKKYKPVHIVSVQLADKTYENVRTLEVMKKYGIDNVRGGAWCSIDLTESLIKSLEERLQLMHMKL